jgi:abequosyltransferase
MKNNILLSICIATYNRARYLPETLESIIPQLSDEVEIVIIDGNSTDDTEDVVNKYKHICNNIIYKKLLTKGGVDKDYSISVSHASGKMCWLFSDDDVLDPDAIDIVLASIKKSFSLIIVNSNVKDVELKYTIENNKLNINSDLLIRGNDLNYLFQSIVPYVSFIGCVVIDREIWLNRSYSQYFGTEFIHVGVIFETHFPEDILLISKPLINIRSGNAQWTDRGMRIWKYNWPRLLFSFEHVDLNLRQRHLDFNTIRNYKDLLIYRSEGAYDFQNYNSYIKWNKKNTLLSKIIFILIAVLPIFFARLLKNTYLANIRPKK